MFEPKLTIKQAETLLALIESHTALIRNLNAQVKQLEKKVAALESAAHQFPWNMPNGGFGSQA